MHHLKTFTICSVIMLVMACKSDNKHVDTTPAIVYHGGDILTMAGDTPEYVEALVVRDGQIIYAGAADEAMNQAGKGHQMVNLEGRTMLPGLIDGHAHFSSFSAQAIGAQILPPPDAGAKDIPTLISILKEWNTPENRALTGWIFGMGFDDSVLEENRFPTKHDLDEVSTEYPIMIVHISGHFAVVNTKGLELLGIDANTPDPEGGIIRREDNNEPNGVLEELAAIPYYAKAFTPASAEAANLFFEAGQEMALSYGYTTAQEGRDMGNVEQFVQLAEAQKLKLDVVSYIDYLFVDKYLESEWKSTNYNNHYRIGGMKVTLDGSPQGRTAWRTTPKDGPSAGITMLTSLVSLFTQRKVKKSLAMTGEITLRGKVLPVGGIKEKILAAKRARIKEIILCADNRKDIEEIKAEYLKGLTFHYVTDMSEVIDIAITKQKVKNAKTL